MPMAAKGLAKLTEEIGELGQVVGKRLAYYTTNEHPDGGEPLDDRMVKEMGDVIAAIAFVTKKFGLSAEAIERRADKKLALFELWDSNPHNNHHAVDGDRE